MISFLPESAVLLRVGTISIHWYAVLYLLAFVVAWELVPRIQHWRQLALSREQWRELLTWSLVGVVVGGRLGYVVLYEPAHFLVHPWQIVQLWHGGMSAHGGMIGVLIAAWIVTGIQQVSLIRVLDVATLPAALGLALGRIGNWINQELYLSTTGHLVAVAKNLIIAAVVIWVLRHTKRSGWAAATFVGLYGVLRFATEHLREQPFGVIGGLTRGQLLALPLIAGAIWWYVWLSRPSRKPPHTNTDSMSSISS